MLIIIPWRRIYALKLLLAILLVSISHLSFSQTTIKGKVSDQFGVPFKNVSVMLEGTSVGTQTDERGDFSIQAAKGNNLVVSFLGFKTQVIPVGDQLSLNVVLEHDISELDDVVVIGYGTVRRSDMTGAVSSLKGDVIAQAGPASIQSAMAGKVAGVTISQTDAAPGAAMNVLIRGGNTLTGGNQPLYVIDGFPLLPEQVSNSAEIPGNPIADISPDQIASIEVLKDASATAIYGAAGSNGVILITTKSGSPTAQIDVSTNNGVSYLSNTPRILTPEEFIDYKVDMSLAELYYLSNTKETNEGNYRTWKKRRNDFKYDPDSYKGSKWIEDITRVAHTDNIDVSFSNSTADKRLSYRIGVGLLSQDGVIINTEFKRQNFNLNLTQKIGKRVDVAANVIMTKSVRKGIVDPWGSAATVKRALMANPFQPREWSLVHDGPIEDPLLYEWTADNILNTVNLVENDNQESRMLANLSLNYRINNDLSFFNSFGTNRRFEDKSTFKSPELNAYVGQGGAAEFIKRQWDNWVYQSRLTYNKRFGNHSINGTGVFEAKENTSKYFAATVQKFQESERGIWDLSTATEARLPLVNDFSDDTMLSFLGRAFYSYSGKYLLTASLRSDGTSKFGKNNKWGYFPSLALGWVASDEKIFENVSQLSFLKLRASYGVTGNNQIGNYISLSQLSSTKYPFGEDLSVGFVHSSIANSDLKWEKTAAYNGGIDVNFFRDRLQLTGEVYYKKTTDLLLEVQIPMTSGYSRAIQNVGSMSTKGWELSLTSINVDKKDFSWSTTLTHSAYRSKVLSLGDNQEMFFLNNIYWGMSNNIMLRVGQPVGIFYGYIEDGVLNSTTEINNSPDQSGVLGNDLGQVKYVDVNQDGKINEADKVPIGKTVPDFTGGMNNQLRYKNLDLVVFMRWSVGNDVINGNTSHMTENYKNWNTIAPIADNVWSPLNPGNNSVGMNNTFWLTNMRSSLVEDGSYLKVDYITLGYSLPQNVTSRLKLSKFRVFAKVHNPIMITRYTWFDPEVSTGWGTVAQVGPGVDLSSYPRSSGVSLGLNVTF